MARALPPMMQVMRDIGGVDLPGLPAQDGGAAPGGTASPSASRVTKPAVPQPKG